MPNRSEILSELFSAYNKTPEMVDFGFLKTFKDSISHMPTPNYVESTCIARFDKSIIYRTSDQIEQKKKYVSRSTTNRERLRRVHNEYMYDVCQNWNLRFCRLEHF